MLLTLGTWLGLSPEATAQNLQHPEHTYGFRCSFDSVQQAEFRRNPGAELDYRNFLRQAAAMVDSPAEQARFLAQPDVVVPVVVHIIHTGGTNNITDRQVRDALTIVNADFSKMNPDTSDVIAAFQPLYANVGFKFRLAQVDPNGNCTTGITRTYSTETNVGDARIKDVIRWDVSKYLNIWVATSANGAGGYAILPCGGGTTLDGIVIRNAQFGNSGTAAGGGNFSARSLTHEIGHYFGLPHTWGGSNTPGLASNCGIDDGIADTPNTTGVGAPAGGSGCPLTSAPCGPLANVQNYMDYSTCAKMFTLGQRAVMRASLLRSCRQDLTTPANLLATGTNDGYSAAPCAPIAAFRPSTQAICEGGSVSFTEYSYNATAAVLSSAQYAWSFPGGQPATSNQRNPTVVYPTSGIYSVSLTVTTADGASPTLTQTNLIMVQGANSGEFGPLVESFEKAGFPENYAAPSLRNWRSTSTVQSGLAQWQRTTSGTASDGAAFLVLRNNLLAAGAVTSLYSPNINLSRIIGPATLTFDRAYAIRSTSSTDQLRVSFSTDCGATWSTPVVYNSQALSTKGTTPITGGFVPADAADWQPLSVVIPGAFQGQPRFQVRLEMQGSGSAGSNPIYLDNFRISGVTSTRNADLTRYAISVFPNPVTEETAVHFTLAGSEQVRVQVRDLLGREVLQTVAKAYGAGQHAISLSQGAGSRLAPGIYAVQLTVGDQTYTTKVLVQ
ncbi:zinc-dependent metalloprotease [Hymenobacter translucens]|uniref:zinc-dependent metalloprotease n=1 Tax=Hymenobacter translucens TaxID=2886507 RepID=UPI001D0F3425|nr:zinc-dependent metalloprotease [Hymenobacter translucens]